MPVRLAWFLFAVMLGVAGLAEAATARAPREPGLKVYAVSFHGNQAISVPELAKRLSFKEGNVVDPGQIVFSRDVLESIYRDKGYADVRISTESRTSASGVEVRFVVWEGPLYRVGDVRVSGNRLIASDLIQRDFGLRRGDPYSQTQVYEGNKRMFLAGLFETTDITTSSTTAHEMTIHLKVKERPTRYIKGGVGYGTQTKERLSIGYEDRNFFGHATKLDLSAVHSGFATHPRKYRTTILDVTLAQPHFLGTPLDGQTSLSQEWNTREPYSSRTASWRSSLGRRFSGDITASLRYRYQGTRITRIDPEAALTTPSFTNVSAIGPVLTYDNTNDPFLPTIGWRISTSFEKAFDWGPGDIDFQRVEARVGRFETLLHHVVIFAGVQAGLVRPDHRREAIPIFERYTLGGGSTVRGYEEQELGPKDQQGSPLGGNAFLVGNLELRHVIYKKWHGVWFLDAGQLYQHAPGDSWPHIRAAGLRDFAFGTGPGIRFNTPVGAVRLEAGYKLNPEDRNSSFLQRLSIHFSLGEVF